MNPAYNKFLASSTRFVITEFECKLFWENSLLTGLRSPFSAGAAKGDLYNPDKDPGSLSTRLIQVREGCDAPSKVNGTLIYLADSVEPLLFHHQTGAVSGNENGIRFPHGSQVRFDCVPISPIDDDGDDEGRENRRQMRSWKIVCEDGRWQGRSLGCDDRGRPLLDHDDDDHPDDQGQDNNNQDDDDFNASCAYNPADKLESNIVAFLADKELKETEYLKPGAELVYRCVDIGERKE